MLLMKGSAFYNVQKMHIYIINCIFKQFDKSLIE